jgi:hypothetical protein
VEALSYFYFLLLTGQATCSWLLAERALLRSAYQIVDVCDKKDNNMQEAHEYLVTSAGGIRIENPNLLGFKTDM